MKTLFGAILVYLSIDGIDCSGRGTQTTIQHVVTTLPVTTATIFNTKNLNTRREMHDKEKPLLRLLEHQKNDPSRKQQVRRSISAITTSSSNTNDTITSSTGSSNTIKVGTSVQQIPSNVCQNDLNCLNDGKCIATPFIAMNTTTRTNATYYYKQCHCNHGFYGNRCEHYCPYECMNGGVCYYTGNIVSSTKEENAVYDTTNQMVHFHLSDYACKCYGYYTGSLCQTPYTNCGDYRTNITTTTTSNTATTVQNVQCYNGGNCLDEPIQVNTSVGNETIEELQYCQCPTNYTGLDCSIPIRMIHTKKQTLIQQRTGLVSFLIGTSILIVLIGFISTWIRYRSFCCSSATFLICCCRRKNPNYQRLIYTQYPISLKHNMMMMDEYEGAICTEPYNIRHYETNHHHHHNNSNRSMIGSSNKKLNNNTDQKNSSIHNLMDRINHPSSSSLPPRYPSSSTNNELQQKIAHLYYDPPPSSSPYSNDPNGRIQKMPHHTSSNSTRSSSSPTSSSTNKNNSNQKNNTKNETKPDNNKQSTTKKPPLSKGMQWKNIV
jgi:hypothetical protein